ncbi:unnamed protein product [Calypogeia fissa]
MAGSERRNDAVTVTGHQLVQYEDDDDNDDKVKSHSGHMASVRRGIGQNTSGSQLGNQAGMEETEDVAEGDRVDEGDTGYQEDIDGGAQEHVYMETHIREGIVAQHQPHIGGADGSDLASEAMRVFCSYDGGPAVHAHTEDASGGVGNDYPEEELQERGLEEAALEERVHCDQSPGYMAEDVERSGEHSSFSSMQQLQLRAQILVYGDLIKGVLPDESLMSSAFSDGIEGTEESDRSPSGWNWEGPWQLAVEKEAERREAERLAEEERINNKSDIIMTEGEVANAGADNLEPGTPSASPIRAAEAAMPQAGGPADLSVTGLDEHATDVSGVPSGLGVNLDAVVDHIVATTANALDISHLKDSAVEAQVTRSPSLDPWLKPHSSPVPSVPGSLAWQTPVQAANAGQAATVNISSVTGGIVADVPSTFAGNAEAPEEGSRKRKGRVRERKTPAAKGAAPTPRRSRAKSASAAKTATPATLPAGAVPARLVYESSEAAVIVQGVSPANRRTGKEREAQGRSNLHADTQNWLEQAKASFEEAVSAANSAAEQVELGKSVTTTPKLESAAAAVYAAASVAKAAAEAAKVAYEAALQAAMMVSDGIDAGLGKVSVGNGQGDKDGGLGGRRSAIAAAKEEARKRAPGATPSMKTTPQTTDAVLRAARLMAEAASQAGAVLAKGNSGVSVTSPLSPVSKLNLNKIERRGRPRKENAIVKSPEPIKILETEPLKSVKGSMKKGARRRGKELQELNAGNTPGQQDGQAKSAEKATRRPLGQVMLSPTTETPEIIEQKDIVEGSFVEVMNDEEGLRGGWFSAKVLQLRPGEAFVLYDEILTDDGTGQLKEWFPLEGPLEGAEPGRPRIRLISPNNIARVEGRRKRRRTTTGQKVVAVGDRVDAFVQDGWWEGIVKAIDEDDESKITLHFPGEGDTSTVKSWNLRPSFMWKDGRWEQWTRDSTGHTKLNDSDQSKNQKVAESGKVQARKSGRGKSTPAGKVSDEATESARASRRAKPSDSQSGTPVAPPITTRSSPRQKIPPKRKEGPTEV